MGGRGVQTLDHSLGHSLAPTSCRKNKKIKIPTSKLQSEFSRKEQNSFCNLTLPPALTSHLLREQPLRMTHGWEGLKHRPGGAGNLCQTQRRRPGAGICPQRVGTQGLPNLGFALSPWDQPEKGKCSQLWAPLSPWNTLEYLGDAFLCRCHYSLPPPKSPHSP